MIKKTYIFSLLFLIIINYTAAQNKTDSLICDEAVQIDIQQFDAKGCMRLYYSGKTQIIKNRNELDSLMRNDMCSKYFADFDFEKNNLFGINLNTGWCRAPQGLSYELKYFEKENLHILTIGYAVPVEPCRALSSYDLWLVLPKLSTGDGIIVEIDDSNTFAEAFHTGNYTKITHLCGCLFYKQKSPTLR